MLRPQVELRLYLASLAATSAEVERVAAMLLSMAAADPLVGGAAPDGRQPPNILWVATATLPRPRLAAVFAQNERASKARPAIRFRQP
jgi:hypothetical protein